MAAIGGILLAVGMIASIVIAIMTIIKCFKAKDTLWGVLTILFGLPGLIWLFMKGHSKLGIYWILSGVLAMVGSVLFSIGVAKGAMNEMENMDLDPDGAPIEEPATP